MADKSDTTNPSASLPRVVPLSGPSGCCYTLRLNGHEVLVDAGNKGKPGDTVVLWPKKKCPVIVRSRGPALCSTWPSKRWPRSTRSLVICS